MLCLFSPCIVTMNKMLLMRLSIWNDKMSLGVVQSLPINQCDGHIPFVLHEGLITLSLPRMRFPTLNHSLTCSYNHGIASYQYGKL